MNKFALMVLLGVTMFSAVAQAGDTLTAESNLSGGQGINSVNGKYNLVMQYDGNLVIYEFGTSRSIWSTGRKNFFPGKYVRMQADGNLVVYNQLNAASWDSRTGGRPYNTGFYLKLNDDGSLKIVDPTGAVIWHTDGDPRTKPICPVAAPVRPYAVCYVGSLFPIDGVVLASCRAEAEQRAAAEGSFLGSCRR